ncbi:hypothetical protein ACWCO9_35020 [Streptomyces sp. NPDC001937]
MEEARAKGKQKRVVKEKNYRIVRDQLGSFSRRYPDDEEGESTHAI